MKAKTILVAAVATLAGLGVAAPAQAKWTPVRAAVVRNDINDLDRSIDRADNRDTISEREAADLRRRLRSLRKQFRQMNANGLTRREVVRLQSRINYIRGRLKMEKVDYDRHAG